MLPTNSLIRCATLITIPYDILLSIPTITIAPVSLRHARVVVIAPAWGVSLTLDKIKLPN